MRETPSGKDKAPPGATARDNRAFLPEAALTSILDHMLNGVAYCRML